MSNDYFFERAEQAWLNPPEEQGETEMENDNV